MARVVAQAILGSPKQIDTAPPVPRWYFLMTDGTIWQFSAGAWVQAPAVPGSRVVNALALVIGDTVFAACTDGTIWSAPITTGFTWSQVATTPP